MDDNLQLITQREQELKAAKDKLLKTRMLTQKFNKLCSIGQTFVDKNESEKILLELE